MDWSLLLPILFSLAGSGGLIGILNARMQHRIALLQQELDERRLRTEQEQRKQDFGLQSMREVLDHRESELTRLRAELAKCQDAHDDVDKIKRDYDLLVFRLQAAESEIRSWKEREARYQTAEIKINQLERQEFQRSWKEQLIIQRIERVMNNNRELSRENRSLKEQLGIPPPGTNELPDLALIGDIREFLNSDDSDSEQLD